MAKLIVSNINFDFKEMYVFMKGKQLYLTHQEIIALYLTIEDFEENASETVFAQRLQNGLGTAWHKLKDCIDSRELAKPID